MTFRLTQQDWDHLLDGEQHLIDLDLIGFTGGLAAFRALVYYQADKRRGTAKTKKLDSTSMIISSFGCRPLKNTNTVPPPTWTPGAQPTHQEQPPTMTVEPQLSAADMEALLGPCTCGQSPTCAPTCDRFK